MFFCIQIEYILINVFTPGSQFQKIEVNVVQSVIGRLQILEIPILISTPCDRK